MSFKSIQKILCPIAIFALLANSLLTPYSVFAQETTPEPTSTPIETPIEVSTPTPEATVLPMVEPIIEPTLEPTATPIETPVETSTPSAEPSIEPISTETPAQGPVTNNNQTLEPTAKPVIVEKGDITTTVVEDVNLSDIVLLNSNVDAPSVVTDKPDYSPTSIVFVTGTNFLKVEEYIIEISSIDEPPVTNSDTLITDENGGFTYSYQLDGNYRPNYKIEVKNGEVVVATTTFTDADSGFRSPSSNTNSGWSSPERVYSTDNNRAQADSSSDTVQYSGFNFSIPSGSTINGIEVNVEGYTTGSRQADISLSWNNGSNYTSGSGMKTTNMSGSSPTSESTKTFGGSSDKWNRTWSSSDFTNFRLKLDATSGNGSDLYIDLVQVKVYYTSIPTDTTPPIITKTISGTLGTNGWYKSNVSVVWTVSDPESSFVIDSGCGTQNFTTETTGTNSTCTAHSTGGSSNSSVNIKIDKASPIITILSYPVSWTNQDITVNATTNEGSLNTNSHIFTSNGTYIFTATDLAGNSSSQGVTITNIDKTLPTISASISNGTLGLNGWYKSDVTVHFTCSDSDSGVLVCPSDQVLNSEENSISSIAQTATDVAGNVSTPSNIITVKIDKTAPTATVNYDVTTPTTGNVIASLAPSENITITNNGGLTSYTFTDNGSFTFEFIDQAGNTGSATATVSNIDRTAPIITINPYNLNLTNQDIAVSASVNEGTLNSDSHLFSENGSFTFIATDTAGNSSSVTVTVTNIDKVAPILINQSFFGSTWYNGWMESVFSYWDENGIASGETQSCMMTTEGANQTCSLTPNVIDNAGNINNTPVTSNTANIDMGAPTGNWVAPIANSTVSGIVDLNFEANDTGSGVKSVEFSYKRNDGIDSFHILSSNLWDTTDLELDTYTLRAIVTDNVNKTITVDEVVGVSAMISNENAVTLGTNSVGVSWTTNKPTTSRVIYDTVSHGSLTNEAPNYGYAYSTDTYNGDKVLNHYITISNLPSGSNFFYRAVSTGSPMVIGPESYFRTYSATGAPAPSGTSNNTLAGVLGANTSTVKLTYDVNQNSDKGTKIEAKTESKNKTENKGAVLGTETKTTNPIKWVFLSAGILVLILIIFKLLKKNK